MDIYYTYGHTDKVTQRGASLVKSEEEKKQLIFKRKLKINLYSR